MDNLQMWRSLAIAFDTKTAHGIAVSSSHLSSAPLGIATYHIGLLAALPLRVRGISVPILRGDPPILNE